MIIIVEFVNKKSLISIIIPCYNQGKYLTDTLVSVYQQTYKNWECIIVDDGSTDHTPEIAREWCAKDDRFCIVKKDNGGLSSARNAGLKIAKGEYIQFLDSDDFLHTEKFQIQLQFFNDDIDIVICDYLPFDQVSGQYCANRYMSPFPDPQYFKDQIIMDWENGLSIPCHTVLFKSAILRKCNSLIFDETLPNHEDYSFWVKIFHYSIGLVNVRESLASYRIHSESMCSDYDKMKYGFIQSCRSNIAFFNSLNDDVKVRLCKKKLKYILIGYSTGIKSIIFDFVPVWVTWYLIKAISYLRR